LPCLPHFYPATVVLGLWAQALTVFIQFYFILLNLFSFVLFVFVSLDRISCFCLIRHFYPATVVLGLWAQATPVLVLAQTVTVFIQFYFISLHLFFFVLFVFVSLDIISHFCLIRHNRHTLFHENIFRSYFFYTSGCSGKPLHLLG